MTEPERPADAPSTNPGPTPEQISARLEALLKRTHALRAQQPAPGASLNITWPPPDRELDHYDVVDVPEDDRMQERNAPSTHAPQAAVERPAVPPTEDATARDTSPGEFARPDWSELRLRGGQDEPAARRNPLWILTVLLALATIGQAGYLWYLHAQDGPRQPGQLRVDGPEGAEVRVNGRAIGPAPIEHALDPGDYDLEVVGDDGRARAQRISIGVGRTVLVLPLTAAPQSTAPPATTSAGPARPATGSGSVPAVSPNAAPPRPPTTPAAVAAAVSPTLGAVLIESTPPGLPVTMEGRERGVTPITIGRLRPGRHDVLVGGLARQVDVTANQVATLRVTRR